MLKRAISVIVIMAFIFTQCGIGYALRPEGGAESRTAVAVGAALGIVPPDASILERARAEYRYVGVSMGGDKLAVAVLDGNNNIIGQPVEFRWVSDPRFDNGQIKDVGKANDVMDVLVELIRSVLDQNQVRYGKIKVVNLSLAGPLDDASGYFGTNFKTPNLPFDKYPFRDELIARLKTSGIVPGKLPMDNDGGAALKGEINSPNGRLKGRLPGGIVIVGGGVNVTVTGLPNMEAGHNLYRDKIAGITHYVWGAKESKGSHPIEIGNTDAEIISKSGQVGREYVDDQSEGKKYFMAAHPGYPMIKWNMGLRDFEDRLSGPSIRKRMESIYEISGVGVPKWQDLITTANLEENKGELERALTPEALEGNYIAIRWIKYIGRELGLALAAFIAAYPDEEFVKHLVLVSGVSENLGKGVYENKADRNLDLDIFIKSMRGSCARELTRHFGMNSAKSRELAYGIVRSQMDYTRELASYYPSDEEVLAAARDVEKFKDTISAGAAGYLAVKPALAKAAGITKERWGKTGGKEVFLYTLTSPNGATVQITSYGAAIVSVKVPDRNGVLADVVLGHDQFAPYTERSQTPYFGCTTGRVCNRVEEGKFTLNDIGYHLATNDGDNHLHGGNEGFDRKVWDVEQVRTEEGMGLRLTYVSPDGEEGYPGTLMTTVTYIWTDDNQLIIDYEAATDKDTVVNFTNHTYFDLPAGKAKTILGNMLMVNADEFTPVRDSGSIPTGEFRQVAGTPFDFRDFHTIGERIDDPDPQLEYGRGYDHNFILRETGKLGELVIAAKVYDLVSGRLLTVRTNLPSMQVYTGNFLDGTIAGKDGRVYGKRSGVCLETQNIPNSPNHQGEPGWPSVVYTPERPLKTRTVYQFGVMSRQTGGPILDVITARTVEKLKDTITAGVALIIDPDQARREEIAAGLRPFGSEFDEVITVGNEREAIAEVQRIREQGKTIIVVINNTGNDLTVNEVVSGIGTAKIVTVNKPEDATRITEEGL